MPTDPNIILTGAQAAPQPFTLGSLAQITQLRQAVQQQRVQNALLQITRQPGAFGADGMPTANTLRQIASVNPVAGMQMAGQMATVRAREATQQKEALGAMQTRRKLAAGPSDAGVSAYYGAISSGATPQQAMQAGREAFLKARGELASGGDLGDALDTMVPKDFNLASAYGASMTAKDAQANYQKNLADQRADQREARTERYQNAELGIQNARLGLEGRRLAIAKRNAENMSGGGLGALDPEAVNEASWDFLFNGKLPPSARGRGFAQQTEIRNQAAKIAKGLGVTPQDFSLAKNNVHAMTSIMTQVGKQSAALDRNAETFRKNAATMMQIARKINMQGPPAVNAFMLKLKEHATGDPDVAAYLTAQRTAAQDYAKIASMSTGAAGTSDTSRKDALETINASFSLPQLEAAFSVLDTDAQNQVAASNDAMNRIRDQMKTAGGTIPSASESPSGGKGKTLVYDPATGTFK